MFEKVLMANRGEIACRIIRALRKLGIRSLAVYSDADTHAMDVAMADVAFRIVPDIACQSDLNSGHILRTTEASAVPRVVLDYDLLSARASFADQCDSSC